MQEESTQRTVALVIRTAKLTGEILKRAIAAYLRDLGNMEASEKHGKMSVKDLVGKGQGAETMDINNGNIRDFDRVAAKYNIDYAVKKDKSVNPPKYVVFFKGRDQDVIAKAFNEYVNKQQKKAERVPFTEKLQQMQHKADILNKMRAAKDKHRTMEKAL